MSFKDEEKEYFTKYYSQLVGAIITSFEWSEAEPGEDTDGWYEPFPVFKANLRGGQKIIITLSQDPEGNGPGFLFLEEDK